MTPPGQRLLVRRDQLAATRIEFFDAHRAPAPGQVQVRVEHFALTANNITYAVFGDSLRYWQFFPAPECEGCIPVWGFGVVEASACAGVAIGQRLYGYWPMATHAWLEPERVSTQGFAEGSAQRRELPAIYNRYAGVNAGDADSEGRTAVLRPLFATAWLIDDFLAEAADFGASVLLLSSASSKTAQATAFCLRRRARRGARVVGATSSGRLDFVRSLGLYDEVVDYDAVASLPAGERAVYMDFAGDAALRRRVHGHWRDALAYSASIGGTHHSALGSARDLPGPRPQLFFAPELVRLRSQPPPEGLGREALLAAIDEAWRAFEAGPAATMPIDRRRGAPAVRESYLEVLAGRADPGRGLMLAF